MKRDSSQWQGAELEKKLQLSSALRIDSDTPQELRERAIATSAGNPRLLEWLDRVLSDAQTDHDAILSSMEAKAEDFRESVLAAKLLEGQKKALRRNAGSRKCLRTACASGGRSGGGWR